MFFRQQTDKTNGKILFAPWANGKWNNENRLAFHFLLDSIYMYRKWKPKVIFLYPVIYTNRNWRFALVPFPKNIYIYLYLFMYTEKYKYGKHELYIYTQNGKVCLFAANGKRKFVFLSRQTINGTVYRRLLFQKTCPSMYSGRGKFMPLSPKTTQIQSVISQVREELGRYCFRHLTQHGQGYLVIKYQLLKIYSFSTAGPQS